MSNPNPRDANHRTVPAKIVTAALAAAMCLALAPTGARANLLVNGGFDDYNEAGSINVESSLNAYTPVSWISAGQTASGRVEIDDAQGLIVAAQSDGWFAKMRGDDANHMYQTVNTAAGQPYTLAFYVARANTNLPTAALHIDVFDGVHTLGAGDGDLLDVTLANADIAGPWTLYQYDFVAASGQTTLRFGDPGTLAVDIGIDTVSIVASGSPAVPTPAALPAGLALLALAASRRRRRGA